MFHHKWQLAKVWDFSSPSHEDLNGMRQSNQRVFILEKVGLVQFARNSLQNQLMDQSSYSTDLKLVIKQNRKLHLLLKNDCCDLGSLSIL